MQLTNSNLKFHIKFRQKDQCQMAVIESGIHFQWTKFQAVHLPTYLSHTTVVGKSPGMYPKTSHINMQLAKVQAVLLRAGCMPWAKV